MNREDVTKLFRFFTALRPDWKPEANALEAWTIVLEPYSYPEVRGAATLCFQQRNYIPTPAEIVAEIPGRDKLRDAPFDSSELAALDAYELLKQRRIRAGLPPTPAHRAGTNLSASEIMDLYEAAGLELRITSGGAI